MSSDPTDCGEFYTYNGHQFRILKRKPVWKLYVWRDREWMSLSQWRTRKEALHAAECFIPRHAE